MTIEQPHWSYSSYDEFMLCGHRYFLRRVEGVPGKPYMAAVGGTAFHKWSELYDGCQISYAAPGKPYVLAREDWENCFLAAIAEEEERSGLAYTQWKVSGKVSKATPNKEDYDWWFANGWAMCQKYVIWRENVKTIIATDLPPDEDGNTLGIEYKLNVELAGLPFVGALDRVEYDQYGNLGVRDIKTGRLWKNVQPGFYAGAARLQGVKLHWWDRYDARKGITVPNPPGQLESWTAGRVTHLLEQAEDQRGRDIYPVRIGEHCSYCPVWQACEYKL